MIVWHTHMIMCKVSVDNIANCGNMLLLPDCVTPTYGWALLKNGNICS